MFLAIIAILVVGQCYLEYVVVKALHLEGFNKKFILGNLAFSILMSIGFGMLFPAAGMTIAAAGLISTILSQPMYRITEWYINTVKPQAIVVKGSYEANRTSIHQTLRDLMKVVMIFVFIITLPFKILRFILSIGERVKSTEQAARSLILNSTRSTATP